MKLAASVCFLLIFGLTGLAHAGSNHAQSVRTKERPSTAGAAKKGDEKPFAELVKTRVKVAGLFTFYVDTVDNSVLMAVKPDQLGPVYLCGETRTSAEGAFFDNSSMGNTYPVYLKRVGKSIMFLEKNLRVRADSASTMKAAIPTAISDHLVGSATVMSLPEDSTKAVLVDPSTLFLQDPANAGFFLNGPTGPGISFDQKNSYFETVKSFPENSEISVKLHYKTPRPQGGATMQNPYSFFHGYHYSISSLPKTDYVPRLGDDRIGYFMDVYQDYSGIESETPYVRYINRWNLKKKDPTASMSEPVEPIVFWIENTVPKEYRDAFAEAIEFWNPAFEKIGIRGAVVAKQMPDDADWDPADVRYSVVRWMIQPGAAYAVGPSRSNPYTGQIYDADIRMSADWLRFMYTTMASYIKPSSTFDGSPSEDESFNKVDNHQHSVKGMTCLRGEESLSDAAFVLGNLAMMADPLSRDSLTKEYVHAYTVEVVAHEIGHTLGFRHNFKASTIYTLDQLADRDFTRKHSMGGSVMDYNGPNLALPGTPQGEFYASVPGPYDKWVVEYGYSDFGAKTPQEEVVKLKEIASRSGDPLLVYSTDEDGFGWNIKSVDPLVNQHEMGSDPLAYSERKIALTKALWTKGVNSVEKAGDRYQKVLAAFQSGWRGFREGALVAPKYVGGLYHNKSHIGDKNANLPFTPVSAADQRRAVEFLSKNIWAADAFDFPADLANKLQPEQFLDFEGSAFTAASIDYPLHQQVLSIQNTALDRLYSPHVLGRLVNNIERFAEGQDKYTIFDMFTQVRKSIWSELDSPRSINSYRRQLQLSQLNDIITIYLSPIGQYPYDARSLASNDLEIIAASARLAAGSSALDGISQAHCKEVNRQIQAAQETKRSYSQW